MKCVGEGKEQAWMFLKIDSEPRLGGPCPARTGSIVTLCTSFKLSSTDNILESLDWDTCEGCQSW